MNAYIVVEGEADADLIRRLIPAEFSDGIAVVAADGRSSAVSLSRTILGARQTPTALVVDSDTTSDALANEQKTTLNDLLRSAAGATPYLVTLAIPETEAILFSAPEVLERIIGSSLSETDRISARFRPKETLERLIQPAGISSVRDLVSRLSESDLARLRRDRLVGEPIEFIRKSLQPANIGVRRAS
ncbi:hypothetical protein [Lamprocystis purpurea]|jgi:hypothetical protein|uniref:hypothetical protein n=1 Tax=Lamprocystis purpurea TaxID=61598 RepID=UPI00035D8EA2|nr:hypothetical protein [Lamprocystis purpurea]